MGLLFGSAGAHTYPKSGQVAPLELIPLELKAMPSGLLSLKLTFEGSKRESHGYVRVTGIDFSFCYDFLQTEIMKDSKHRAITQIIRTNLISQSVL